jgi:hypothetical protein
MKHTILLFCGLSGTGKDTAAETLVNKFSVPKVSMINKMRIQVMDTFRFPEDSVFGRSEKRNVGSLSLPKKEFFEEKISKIEGYWKNSKGDIIEPGDPKYWLSPREALINLVYTYEQMYQNILSEQCFRYHEELFHDSIITPENTMIMNDFVPSQGVVELQSPKYLKYPISITSDARRPHQIMGMKKLENEETRVISIRVKRPGFEKPAYDHPSETEQAKMTDDDYDFVIMNDGSINDLHKKVISLIEGVMK